jgi:hypothetical protein
VEPFEIELTRKPHSNGRYLVQDGDDGRWWVWDEKPRVVGEQWLGPVNSHSLVYRSDPLPDWDTTCIDLWEEPWTHR